MIRLTVIMSVALATTACGTLPTYEAEPQSAYQWQRRQDRLVAAEAERVRVCATLTPDSARYKRDCLRPGDPA